MTANPLVITQGDPAGIGTEIAVKALRSLGNEMPLVLIGDAGVFASEVGGEGIHIIPDLSDLSAGQLNILHRPFPAPVRPGAPDPRNAQRIADNIAEAVHLCQSGQAAGLVTNPINKDALQSGTSFPFPGHTEYLAHLTGVEDPIMLLAAPELRVVPLTIHVALREVPALITADHLSRTIQSVHSALQTDFGIADPRIAVAGLNPHAGENGRMGREEIEIIQPVMTSLREKGYRLTGPSSADTMFTPSARADYDVAICMYHDQALIPIKTLAFDAGVNVTLGLPIVRTSPDHGTAYDIAGTGVARADSLISAIRLAWEISGNRGLR